MEWSGWVKKPVQICVVGLALNCNGKTEWKACGKRGHSLWSGRWASFARWMIHHVTLHQDPFNGDTTKPRLLRNKQIFFLIPRYMLEFYYLLLRKSLWDRDCCYQHFTVVETHVLGSRTVFREQDLSGLIGNLWPSHRALLLAFIASLASSPLVYLHRPMLSYWTDLRQSNGSPTSNEIYLMFLVSFFFFFLFFLSFTFITFFSSLT